MPVDEKGDGPRGTRPSSYLYAARKKLIDAVNPEFSTQHNHAVHARGHQRRCRRAGDAGL